MSFQVWEGNGISPILTPTEEQDESIMVQRHMLVSVQKGEIEWDFFDAQALPMLCCSEVDVRAGLVKDGLLSCGAHYTIFLRLLKQQMARLNDEDREDKLRTMNNRG